MKAILAKSIAAAAVAMTAAGTAASAAAEDYLGTRVVAYGSETDVIEVPGPKRFTAIKLCVSDRAVHFRDLDVVYGNGARDDLKLRVVIPKGDCTRWIDLRGGDRNIRRIVMKYDTLPNTGPRAKVTAFGR